LDAAPLGKVNVHGAICQRFASNVVTCTSNQNLEQVFGDKRDAGYHIYQSGTFHNQGWSFLVNYGIPNDVSLVIDILIAGQNDSASDACLELWENAIFCKSDRYSVY
jgi:hypothetical protein